MLRSPHFRLKAEEALVSRGKTSCIKRIPVLHAGATQVVGRRRLEPSSLRLRQSGQRRATRGGEEEEAEAGKEGGWSTKTHTRTLAATWWVGGGWGSGDKGKRLIQAFPNHASALDSLFSLCSPFSSIYPRVGPCKRGRARPCELRLWLAFPRRLNVP